jgi:hypothetical protein
VAKRGSKKVRPIYEDNQDCVLLYACGWSEYTSLPSNSHIKYNCPGKREYTTATPTTTTAAKKGGITLQELSHQMQLPR